MLSIKEISEKTGYSTATVSRALDPRYRDKVKPVAREKIMTLCDQYRYRPKFSARALASGKTYTIGLISADVKSTFNSPTYSVLVRTLAHELKRHNYALSILPIKDSPEVIDEEILQTFGSSRVDGFILAASMVRNSTLQELADHKFPVVTFFMPSELVSGELPVTNVCVENSEAYLELFRHLKKQGRKCPVFVGIEQSVCSRTRQCLECARKAGFQMDDADIVLLPAKTRKNEVYGTYKAVKEHWARLSPYDSWIMSNDLMAYGAWEACGEVAGRGIAIAGYDNIAEISGYDDEMSILTTIDPKLEQFGAIIIQSLLQQINQADETHRRITVQSKLKIRKSTQQEIS